MAFPKNVGVPLFEKLPSYPYFIRILHTYIRYDQVSHDKIYVSWLELPLTIIPPITLKINRWVLKMSETSEMLITVVLSQKNHSDPSSKRVWTGANAADRSARVRLKVCVSLLCVVKAFQ